MESWGAYYKNHLYTLFSIKFTLTDKGFDDVDAILEAIFSYLLLLNSSNSFYETFLKLKGIADAKFKFKEDSDYLAVVIIDNAKDI